MKKTAHPKPTFLIAGMQKAGTSSLYSLLSSYPEIYMSPRKELHLFSTGEVTQQRFARYLEWFAAASADQARGEASPIYSYLPGAMESAREWLGGGIRIVLILRDPVARAYSHYWHEIKMGCEYLPFREALERCQSEDRDLFYHRHHSYLERSLYTAQIERARALFGDNNVLVVRLEDLKSDPAVTVNRVVRFVAPGAVERSEEELRQEPRNAARIPKRTWPNHLLGRINSVLRRNITPRRLLEINHVVGRYPRISSDDARFVCDELLDRDPGLLSWYPDLVEVWR